MRMDETGVQFMPQPLAAFPSSPPPERRECPIIQAAIFRQGVHDEERAAGYGGGGAGGGGGDAEGRRHEWNIFIVCLESICQSYHEYHRYRRPDLARLVISRLQRSRISGSSSHSRFVKVGCPAWALLWTFGDHRRYGDRVNEEVVFGFRNSSTYSAGTDSPTWLDCSGLEESDHAVGGRKEAVRLRVHHRKRS